MMYHPHPDIHGFELFWRWKSCFLSVLQLQITGGRYKRNFILTCPDDWGHKTRGAFLACYWWVPPRWSPRHKEEDTHRKSERERERARAQIVDRQNKQEHPPFFVGFFLLMYAKEHAHRWPAGLIMNYILKVNLIDPELVVYYTQTHNVNHWCYSINIYKNSFILPLNYYYLSFLKTHTVFSMPSRRPHSFFALLGFVYCSITNYGSPFLKIIFTCVSLPHLLYLQFVTSPSLSLLLYFFYYFILPYYILFDVNCYVLCTH